jgi:hypothetical protein
MSPHYLLDIDTMLDLIWRPSGVEAGWITRVGEEPSAPALWYRVSCASVQPRQPAHAFIM